MTEPTDQPVPVDAEQLLRIIGELVTQLHPNSHNTITLDSSLERELAIDSLSRMELLNRLEKHFGVSLSERSMTEAESPRDLMRALQRHTQRSSQSIVASMQGETRRVSDLAKPESASTLIETLEWHVAHHPERIHVYFYDEDDQRHSLTYGELWRNSQRIAQGLRDSGLNAGDGVAIMLPTCLAYFYVFFGVLMAGGTPVPIYPPTRASQIEDHVLRHSKILGNALVKTLVTFDEVKSLARLLRTRVPELENIFTTDDLASQVAHVEIAPIKADDIAFLQYTSGSTGNPKGVVLTHANILANIRAMDKALQTTPNDVFVSWLPLYHDMGLIGAWMGALYVGFTLVLLSPLSFLGRPVRWLRTIHEHKGTVSGGPNFAFELCLSRIDDEQLQGLDLSSWRLAFNGAEPVSADTLRRFALRFGAYGLPSSAIAPVYGLAEATLGVGFPPLGRGLHTDVVSKEILSTQGRAEPVDSADKDAIEIVACGQPMAGYQVKVTDAQGRELPERHQGRLEFKGPSTTSGYFRNPSATDKLFRDGWLDSGDLAYIADGDIFITSREKDMIIRAGRNIYPYELEEAVGSLEGVRKGCVALFASPDADNRTEKLVLVAETREKDPQTLANLRRRIGELAVQTIGMPLDAIELAPPRSVLKTSSGKIRRSATSEDYQTGKLGGGGRSVAWQIARLALSGAVPQLRRGARRLRTWVFACWVWSALFVLGLVTAIGVFIMPTRGLRWRVVRACSRTMRWLSTLPVDISGLDNLPDEGAFVLVCNHQSYIDAPLLSGVLPVDLVYVAKAELVKTPVIGPLLRRLGLEFVDRLDKERSVQDARRINEVLRAGQAIAYFPEGTLRRMPGLLPFQMGAFVSAAGAQVPVIPVVIRGTRSVLRDESWFPRRSPVRINVGPALYANPALESEWAIAIDLRDRARADILKRLAEPDLIETRVAGALDI